MKLEVVRTKRDIAIGMTKYRVPPPHGMLFILKGQYSILTMYGMRYSLRIFLYDRNWIGIGDSFVAHPGDQMRLSPSVYYMVEIPV